MTREQALERAQRIREVMLAHGVPQVSIELQTGRRGSDDWNGMDPVAVMSHHIASHPSASNPVPGLALVKRGRSDLPGPLANGTAGVDLVYRILTLGWANHPGYGGPWTVEGPCGSFTIPKDNARVYAWGTEYEGGYSDAVWDQTYTNRATGKSMTFREFMGRCNAALVEAIWLPGVSSRGKYDAAQAAPLGALAGYHGEHKTWAPGRKPDRLNYTTESGRAELRRYDVKQEDEMAQYKDQLDRIEANQEEILGRVRQDLKEGRAGRQGDVRRYKDLKSHLRRVAALGREGNTSTEELSRQVEELAAQLPDDDEAGS